MVFTDDKYIDGNGGLFIEYYGDNGFYRYIHVNKRGQFQFLPEDTIVDGKKCTYYIDYCSSEALTAELMLNDLRESFKGDMEYYKKEAISKYESLEAISKYRKEESEKESEKVDFTADDIPF